MSRLLTVLSITILAATSTDVRAASEPIITVEFAGGTAAQYVRSLRAVATDANIVAGNELEFIPMPPLELKRVTIGSALSMLTGSFESPAGDRIVIHLQTYEGGEGSAPVYRLRTEEEPGRRRMHTVSRIWSIAHLVDDDLDADDVVTAIETSLDLFEGMPAAGLRYHEETRLLLGRGHRDQIETVNAVIEELTKGQGRERERQADAAAFRALRERLEQLEGIEREANELRTRAELFREEIGQLRDELARTRDTLEHAVRERDDIIRQLQSELESMRRTRPDGGGR